MEMLVYVLSEMRVIIDEYREMQSFIAGNDSQLDRIINTLLFDLFLLYFGVDEGRAKEMIDKYGLYKEEVV